MRISRRLLVAWAAAVAACSQPPRGSVAGDVYFAGGDGEGKRASGITVWLLREPDTVTAHLGRICASYSTEMLRLKQGLVDVMAQATQAEETRERIRRIARAAPLIDAVQDTIRESSLRAIQQVNALLGAHRVDSATTRIDAHYAFRGVAPANYALVARGDFGGLPRTWRRNVVIRTADSLVADLGIAEERPWTEFYCGLLPADLEQKERSDTPELRESLARVHDMDAADARGAAAIAKQARDERARIEEDKKRDAAALAAAYDLGKVDVAPRVISGSAGQTVMARADEPRGDAEVSFLVERDGSVSHVVVSKTESATAKQAIYDVITGRRYAPGKVNGEPVAVRMVQIFQVR